MVCVVSDLIYELSDSEVMQSKLQPLSRPSLIAKKRPIEPELPAAPTSKETDLKDPRLEKIRSLPTVPKAISLPVPTFVDSDDQPGVSSPKKRRLEPIRISSLLAKYLKEHTSSKSKTSAKTSDVVESSVETHSIASRKRRSSEERAGYERTLGFISKCRGEGSSTESPPVENSPSEELPLLVSKVNREALPVDDTNSVPHDSRIGKYVVRRRSKELNNPLEYKLVCSKRRETANAPEVRKKSSQPSDNVPEIAAQTEAKTFLKKMKERQLIHGNSSELPSEVISSYLTYEQYSLQVLTLFFFRF